MHEQADEHSLQTIANKALLRLLGYPAHTLYALFCCSAAVELEPQQSFSQYLHQLVHLQNFGTNSTLALEKVRYLLWSGIGCLLDELIRNVWIDNKLVFA